MIEFISPESTVYSDRLSINYPPISDAFDKIDYFFCIMQTIQLWHCWDIACSLTINKTFFSLLKKHLKCVIQCSMIPLFQGALGVSLCAIQMFGLAYSLLLICIRRRKDEDEEWEKQLPRIVFLKMGHPRLLFRLFLSFPQNIIPILQQMHVKMFIQCWDSNPWPLEHESPPLTTRPGSRAH